ncbi:MAG: CRTAC1 family protein [Sphingobacteriia bacterium]|nr:MAG: CRTAC1 family protein [Sphingobacteriia bacterium]
MSRTAFFFIASLSIFLSCKEKNTKTLFNLLEKTDINFINKIVETKEFNVFKYRNFYNGAGVATGDLNNDGLPEIFFTANQGANQLYLNKGNLKFENISEKAGFLPKKQWSTGVVMVDINADGWLDIYICNAGNMMEQPLRKNQLFVNNRDLTFTERAKEYGLDNDGYSTQASFFDYDLDGDLDCFLVNNSPIPVNSLNYANMRSKQDADAPFAAFLKGGGDHLYRNDAGYFTEVSKSAGIYGSIISFGLGVTVGDVNQDGYPDIYVSNDFFEKDYLYINQKNGTFKDEMEIRIQHTSFSSMGADMQDINNDGIQDIFTTDMLPSDDYRLKTNTTFDGYDIYRLKQKQGFYNQFTQNTLQVNNGSGKFLETAFYSGVAASDWSWGALLFDADSDGLADIFVCNGIYRDVTDQDFIDFFANDVVKQMVVNSKKEDVGTVIDKMPSVPVPNKAFRNIGALQFKDEGNNWGFETPTFSNGAAYADLDNDGDLDLVINNVNQPAMVYQNNASAQNKANYLSISLKYKSPNNFAIGSTIKVYKDAQIITRTIMPSRGFQSSVEYKQTIGLGSIKPDSLQIIWPDLSITSILKPLVDTLHLIDYATSIVKPFNAFSKLNSTPLFTTVEMPFDQHKEDDYVDFYIERNIPFMLSRQGPKSATADVNGDGMTDIFIGGAAQQPSQLYLQTTNGFVKKQTPDFLKYTFNDITAAFFFDADQDGDMDLFCGGGGNFAAASSELYQNHLYLNDGKANFSLKPGAFAISHTNCGSAIPLDYDGDGKLDVFIGSRSTPQHYGILPKSFLYHNMGNGLFQEVSTQIAPFLSQLGMITSAAWSDINGDLKKELIIVGEWMYPHVYRFEKNKFIELKTGLENYIGWWQQMAIADLDNDGDADLVLGNLGNNFYLKPTETQPVKLWMNDFDQNGSMDKVFSQTIQGKDVPVFMKRDITDQMPFLKKANLRHSEFATKSIQELFDNTLDKASMLQVNYTSSAIAYNDGKGNFNLKPLPTEAQLSSIHAIALSDINKDGYVDILIGGNMTDLLPQFCSIDASYGNILINNKKTGFITMPAAKSGLHITKQIRDIVPIKTKQKQNYLFLINNGFPVFLYQND